MKIGPEGFMDASEQEFAALDHAVQTAMPSLSGVRFEALRHNYAIKLDPPATGKFIGGTGITGRTIDSVQNMIPTVHERLLRETGKIIFLGNGLSDIPLIAAEMCISGALGEAPVITDVFDYRLLQEDYERIIENCRKNKIELPPHVKTEHKTLIAINQFSKYGYLKTIVYHVGSRSVPADLKNASLVINCMGPSAKSLKEQISMLAIGGDLYTTYYLESFGKNASLTLIPSTNNLLDDNTEDEAAYIYTRTS